MKLAELYEAAHWQGEGPVEGELEDLLHKECPGLMQRLGNNGLLYRGAGNIGEHVGLFQCGNDQFDVYRNKVRKDRVPLSMPKDLSRVVDDWMEKKFDFRARSRGIFCFGEGGRASAHSYGSKNCVMFPVGSFSYLWSPQVDDLYEAIDELMSGGKLNLLYRREDGSPDPDTIGDWLDSKKYTMNGLRDAVKTNCEIMVDCDEVLYIWYHNEDSLKRLHGGLGIDWRS